jgi:hypothetical protein
MQSLADRATGFSVTVGVLTWVAETLATKAPSPPIGKIGGLSGFTAYVAGAGDRWQMDTAMNALNVAATDAFRRGEPFVLEVTIRQDTVRGQKSITAYFHPRGAEREQVVPCLTQCGGYYMALSIEQLLKSWDGIRVENPMVYRPQ